MLELGCNYCGDPVLNSTGSSLDRLDSSKGYTITNVVPCCKYCNIAKNDRSIPEFIHWIDKVYNKTQEDLKACQKMLDEDFNSQLTREKLVNKWKQDPNFKQIIIK